MALGVTVVSATAAAGQSSYGQPAQLAQKGGGGWLKVRVATITGDGAYPAGAGGGYPVTASTFLFSQQLLGIFDIASAGVQVPYPEYDYTNNVIRFYQSSGASTASEVASGTSLSAVTWRLMVIGY